ncbi:MAG: phosphatase PAP2 family protein [Candidatus Aenigmarchaeota archaeon]|nr:phosphatase PAP2 family protein [Candidatus Aenigmarchaeota archaeon]
MADIWVFLTLLGQPEFWGILGVVLTFIYFTIRQSAKPEMKEVFKRALIFFAMSLLLSVLITQGLKYAFDEERPCIVCGPSDALCNEYCLSTPSFPSGHAAITFAGFTSLFFILKRKKKMFPIFIIPILTALSRVMLGVHFWQDIIVGSLIGIAIPIIVHQLKEKWWDF